VDKRGLTLKIFTGLGIVAHACNPNYVGGMGRRIVALGGNSRSYLKNKLKQKGLEVWLRW
jgi:hypothetical protein